MTSWAKMKSRVMGFTLKGEQSFWLRDDRAATIKTRS
jgi:hypothetical protein